MANTREKLLVNARRLFAERGFYGTSIQDVAAEVGISKQALLHHFTSKEKLYGEVLQGIADRILQGVAAIAVGPASSQSKIEAFVGQLIEWMAFDVNGARIIMRELLDNQPRAATATHWYLQPLIEALVSLVEQGQRSGEFRQLPALAFIYSLLGAAHYYAVSIPTLERMLTESEFRELAQQHEAELVALIRARLVIAEEVCL